MGKTIKIMMAMALIVSIAACGKAAKPDPIEGSGYPHAYPKPMLENNL